MVATDCMESNKDAAGSGIKNAMSSRDRISQVREAS
jgi:hypothetical protein